MTKMDYLVIGAGAAAMAFVDVMLDESDASFTIVDKRQAPGGHWNDAYPFVRLHQPSASYGVASRALGTGQKDTNGPNKGLHELASGREVAAYFRAVMQEKFLPSDRVAYYPGHKYLGDGVFASLRTGERKNLGGAHKLLDATLGEPQIPLTHKRRFDVAEDAVCIPPNDLPDRMGGHDHFAVLGAGKTGIDCVLYLLAEGVDPARVTWVAPRDPWLLNRITVQPGIEFFDRSFGGVAAQYEACAAASSVHELCEGMEAAGLWLRVDPNVWPTMIHGAIISEGELALLRRVEHIVRKGRVRGLESARLVLDQGEVRAPQATLFIDCTARAFATDGVTQPVFTPGRIAPQMLRLLQPIFSAAIAGFIEARVPEEAEKQRLAQACPMTDSVEDWIASQLISMANQHAWSSNKEIRAWMRSCRLSGFGPALAEVRKDDAAKQAILERMARSVAPAALNLARLVRLRRDHA